MIEPTRQEILARLERLSELAPDMRFGQLIRSSAWDARTAPLGFFPGAAVLPCFARMAMMLFLRVRPVRVPVSIASFYHSRQL